MISQNWGIMFPSPLFCHYPQCIYKTEKQNFKIIQKVAGTLPVWNLHAPK
jgi:hypothetical protein